MDMDDMQEPDDIDESQLIDPPHATQSTQPRDFGLKPRRPFQRWTPEQKTRYHRLRPRLRRHVVIEEEDEEDAEAARNLEVGSIFMEEANLCAMNLEVN
jgi:hypothetical protein